MTEIKKSEGLVAVAARQRRIKGMYCNPDVCPYCQYIGEGDSWCEETGEIVLSDWAPTDDFMGPGCPYLKKEGDDK